MLEKYHIAISKGNLKNKKTENNTSSVLISNTKNGVHGTNSISNNDGFAVQADLVGKKDDDLDTIVHWNLNKEKR